MCFWDDGTTLGNTSNGDAKGIESEADHCYGKCSCKLHNFCIAEVDTQSQSVAPLQQLSVDTLHIMNHEDGYVPMESSNEHGITLPCALMEPGHHFVDVPRNVRRQHERANAEATLP